MKNFSMYLMVLLGFLSISLAAQNKVDNSSNAFIDKLMKQMTLEEKLGQLNLPITGDIVTGVGQNSGVTGNIKAGKVGAIFGLRTVAKIKELQRIAVEQSRLKIPLLFGLDVIHGYVTAFPIPLALSCSWDMDLIEKSARIAAIEASADGINWTFSPMVDICRDPRWGRIAEGSGEDPYLGAQIAARMVKGYQGNLESNTEIMACVKHFALYGAAEGGRDYNTVDMSRIKMFNEYFPPFKAAVDAGVESVMASFNEVEGIPATGSKFLMTDVLRTMWGFNGFVVSDYTGISEMIAHGMGDLEQVSALALNAGVDMDMVSEGYVTTIKKALRDGLVSMEVIDRACRRILEAKYKLGLFANPYKFLDESRASKEIFTSENRQFARKAAAESCVLLKNSENILPLKQQGTIAVIGPLGDNKENMVGTWSVSADFSKAISLFTGLSEEMKGKANVLYARGSWFDYDSLFELRAGMFGKSVARDGRSTEELLQEALALAAKSDVIIAALGESAEMSGESSSRTDLNIPKAQQDLLKELLKTGKPVVLVLFTGRPLTLTWEDVNVPAILNTWFGGTEAGRGIADVLTGKVNPGGKLTSTFPQNVGQIPLYYAHKNTGRPLISPWFQKFQSNYLDVTNEPLYPFGYGLSYTTFSYTDMKIKPSKTRGSVEVSILLTNTGKTSGAEVVQLYIRDLVASITRPVKELKKFSKIYLQPGESKVVQFDMTLDDFKFYNSKLEFLAEPGDFKIFVGGNSRDVLSGDYKLGK